MKQIRLIILIFILIGCSVSGKLNRQIDHNQRKSLKSSPFETANGMKTVLKKQKKLSNFAQ